MPDIYTASHAAKQLPRQDSDIRGKVSNFNGLKNYVDGTDAQIEHNYGGDIATGTGTNVTHAFYKVYGSIEDQRVVNKSLVGQQNTKFGKNVSTVGQVFITQGVSGRYYTL